MARIGSGFLSVESAKSAVKAFWLRLLPRCVFRGFTSLLPPEPHAEEIDRAVSQHPKEAPLAGGQFAQATHAGTPPALRAAVELAADEKNVPFTLGNSGRFDGRDANGIFQLRLADERDLAGLAVDDFMDVAFLHFRLDVKSIEACHFEKPFALLDRRAEPSAQLA